MKMLLEQRDTSPDAALAVQMFCYQLRKQIGAYAAALGGLDVLVFTVGIGERAAPARWETCVWRIVDFFGKLAIRHTQANQAACALPSILRVSNERCRSRADRKMDFIGRKVRAGAAGRCLRRIVSGTAMSVLMSLTLQATMTYTVWAQYCNNLPSGIGSAEDYAREQNPELVHEVPELGIEVSDGIGRLETGALLRGATVTRVIPEGPAARAGLGNEPNTGTEPTKGKLLLMGALAVGGLFFPPAFFLLIAVGHDDTGESHDTIIAVDSERTRDAEDLENAIGKSSEGPVVYLSVVRDGHRNQIKVYLRAGSDQTG